MFTDTSPLLNPPPETAGPDAELDDGEIATGSHCFGCTAGAGSSCGGALT